jgi:hypothetical protein
VVLLPVLATGTPAAAAAAPPSGVTASALKRRGRPTRAEMQEREVQRQAAIARGEPDPELKRKRRKPNKLKDGVSDVDTEEDKGKAAEGGGAGGKAAKQRGGGGEGGGGRKRRKPKVVLRIGRKLTFFCCDRILIQMRFRI